MSRGDPLPFGLALCTLGLGIFAITFLSLGQDDVSFARTQWTALLSMTLAAPAILLYAGGRAPHSPWWRSFWTVSFLAYVVHFWWGVFRSFNGDFEALIEREGWVAYGIFVVTIVWGLDVITAWIKPSMHSGTVPGLHFLAWFLVTVSFVLATAIFRSGPAAYAGYAFAAAVLCALIGRVAVRRRNSAVVDKLAAHSA
jgi:hypothetical protein